LPQQPQRFRQLPQFLRFLRFQVLLATCPRPSFLVTSSQPSQRIQVGQIARPFFLRIPCGRERVGRLPWAGSRGIVFETVIHPTQSEPRASATGCGTLPAIITNVR
jgi:hypothetical protein